MHAPREDLSYTAPPNFLFARMVITLYPQVENTASSRCCGIEAISSNSKPRRTRQVLAPGDWSKVSGTSKSSTLRDRCPSI